MFGLIVGAIGSLVTGAMSVAKVLSGLKLVVDALKIVGNAIASIAKALGIIKPERDVEELGDRALQAEEMGIKPEDYDSYEAWVRKIEDDNWGYDPEKNKDMNAEDKILKGVEVSTAVTMEKFPNLPIQEFYEIVNSNKEFFTVERMDEIGKLACTDGDAFENVINYMTNKTNDSIQVNEAIDILMDIEMKIDPTMNEDRAYNKVTSYHSFKV